jgi:hypothetical protein
MPRGPLELACCAMRATWHFNDNIEQIKNMKPSTYVVPVIRPSKTDPMYVPLTWNDDADCAPSSSSYHLN